MNCLRTTCTISRLSFFFTVVVGLCLVASGCSKVRPLAESKPEAEAEITKASPSAATESTERTAPTVKKEEPPSNATKASARAAATSAVREAPSPAETAQILDGAHNAIDEGLAKYQTGDWDSAAKDLFSAITGYERLIDHGAALDATVVDAALAAVLFWQKTLKSQFKPVPEQFPLADLWARHERDAAALEARYGRARSFADIEAAALDRAQAVIAAPKAPESGSTIGKGRRLRRGGIRLPLFGN